MPKRDIPVDADEDTRFALIMDGLVDPASGGLKPPKNGLVEGEVAKWHPVGEKPAGRTEGFLVRKNTSSGSAKASHTWLYKTSKPTNMTRYFYASFCETAGSELFRYTLGECAPKNRLVIGALQIPGLVSRFLPDFISFAKMQENGKESFVITAQHGIHKIIAANCFFNDYDGTFANTGLFTSTDGRKKVGRVDFGAVFSQLLNHSYGIATYLFDKGKYSYRYRYAMLYAPLLQSEEFRLSIESMSQINIEHIKAITKASVARFVEAWRTTPIEAPAIEKLFSHLYGEDKQKWHEGGFQDDPTVCIDLDRFNEVICNHIIAALTERKNVFGFFARALSYQRELNTISEKNVEEQFFLTGEMDVQALIKEAINESSDHKRLLLSWLTNNKLQFTLKGKLIINDVTGYPLTPLERDEHGVYPIPNAP